MKLKTLSLLALLCCTACTTPTHVRPDGSYDQLVWPELQDATIKEGYWPNPTNLNLIYPNETTKNQMFELIGRPHFNEGFRSVREWNYIFHAKNSAGETVTCQYKVLYNDKMIVTSTHWHPVNCIAHADQAQMVTLATDALFAFDRWQLADVTTGGHASLNALARQIQDAGKDTPVKVFGYTDRLGSEAYNHALSQRRADTIRDYLIAQGVNAAQITAEGRGISRTANCTQQNTANLRACLAPDRKVVIQIGD